MNASWSLSEDGSVPLGLGMETIYDCLCFSFPQRPQIIIVAPKKCSTNFITFGSFFFIQEVYTKSFYTYFCTFQK